jgi:hypothetical protein
MLLSAAIAWPSLSIAATQCAIVYAGGWNSSWMTQPVKAFCPPGGQGQACDVQAGDPISCSSQSEIWYQ